MFEKPRYNQNIFYPVVLLDLLEQEYYLYFLPEKSIFLYKRIF